MLQGVEQKLSLAYIDAKGQHPPPKEFAWLIEGVNAGDEKALQAYARIKQLYRYDPDKAAELAAFSRSTGSSQGSLPADLTKLDRAAQAGYSAAFRPYGGGPSQGTPMGQGPTGTEPPRSQIAERTSQVREAEAKAKENKPLDPKQMDDQLKRALGGIGEAKSVAEFIGRMSPDAARTNKRTLKQFDEKFGSKLDSNARDALEFVGKVAGSAVAPLTLGVQVLEPRLQQRRQILRAAVAVARPGLARAHSRRWAAAVVYGMRTSVHIGRVRRKESALAAGQVLGIKLDRRNKFFGSIFISKFHGRTDKT